MKFSDIKQFPQSNYMVHQPWRTLLKWKEDMIETYNMDLNPDFQRGYIWGESQKRSYLEYILRGGVSGRSLYFNHPSWMKEFNENDRLEIVDGKQRLTTVIEFLENKVKAFDHYYNEFEDQPHLIGANFEVHVASLQNRKELIEWYINFNTGGSIHTEDDLRSAYEALEKLTKYN